MKSKLISLRTRVSGALLAAAASSAAMGQQSVATRADLGLEEIIVTAQKREERLRDVPVSVAVQSGADLELAQVSTVVGLGDRFANLAMPDTGSRGQTILLRIRGFGNNGVTRTLRAGIIVDDVPYLSPRGLNAGLFDMSQVQVLRGPQSTLYGLTAQAGLVIVESARPDLDAVAGRVALQYGSDGEYLAQGRVSMPVMPGKLAVALSGVAGGGDGWIDNVVTGDSYGESENWGARFRALAQPTENLSFLLTVAREEVDDGAGLVLLPVDRAAFAAATGVRLGDFESAQDYEGYVENTDDTASLTVRWEGSRAEFVSVSAYRDFETLPSFDIDQGPEPVQIGPFSVLSGQPEATTRAFSQELRLQSSDSGPLMWTAGAFYYETEDTTIATANIIAPIQTVLTIGPRGESQFTSRSVFGQAGYTWKSGWSLTGGARYEDVELEDREDGIPRVARYEDTQFLPKITAGYALSEEIRFYATVGRGWLAGGVFVGDSSADDRFYLPEESTTYEAGVKGSWFDGKLDANLSVFKTDVDDYQEIVRTGLITSETSNAGEVSFEGFELELVAAIAEHWTLSAALGISDAKYEDFVEFDPESGQQVNRAGNRVPGVAESDYRVSLAYRNPLGWFGALEVLGSGDILEGDDTLNVLPVIDGYDILNVRTGYDAERWSVGVFCNNLSNEAYFVSGNDQLGDGVVFGAPGRKRHYGVTAEYRFGR
jgi:iron complex outermembrane receptor protein